jgi:3-hydroxyacyl-[acyl-carrier-protein] dehydratase
MRWFWVDRFVEFVAGSHAVARKGIALSDNFMHDHWDAYPIMPHTLIAEGMAQTGGLLTSELYKFKELVVLAKFSSLQFHGETHGGDCILYRAQLDNIRDVGAMVSVTGHVGEELRSSAQIFFARLQSPSKSDSAEKPKQPSGEEGMPIRLFDPEDLCHWLHLVGVFEVGRHADGSRMHPKDYGLPLEGEGDK